jgi:probable HAF family extracellular repeat protein
MKFGLAGLFVVGLLASAATLRAQNYNVIDLGVLSGDSTSTGAGLDDTGQAAGRSSNPSAAIATLFSNGKAINLGNLGGDVSLATAINSAGQLAGRSTIPGETEFHAFLYSNGVMMDIHSASLFPAGTYAYGINKSGQVVGQGLVDSSTFHAFLYTGGHMIDLGTFPGGNQATAVAINDAGQITGTSDGAIVVSKKTTEYFSHAFLYANGKMNDLGMPSGANYSEATAINGNGQIVGSATFSDGTSHAVLYSNGVWTDLGKFPGASGTQATGINLAGQIVGTAFFPQQSYHPPIPGKHVPFIVRSGALIDLNTLIAANSGFKITDAMGINGSGQILCDATNSSGFTHAVLLTPK